MSHKAIERELAFASHLVDRTSKSYKEHCLSKIQACVWADEERLKKRATPSGVGMLVAEFILNISHPHPRFLAS
jgi:hypothetical protein